MKPTRNSPGVRFSFRIMRLAPCGDAYASIGLHHGRRQCCKGMSGIAAGRETTADASNRHNASMPGELIPLFPLQVVLLPRAPLPLHIIEDRYKEMMQEVIAAEGEFGVVMSREQGILNTGCTATIERILRQFEDGRMDRSEERRVGKECKNRW